MFFWRRLHTAKLEFISRVPLVFTGCRLPVVGFGAQMCRLIISSKDLFQEICEAAILFLADVVVKQLLTVHYVTVIYNAC